MAKLVDPQSPQDALVSTNHNHFIQRTCTIKRFTETKANDAMPYTCNWTHTAANSNVDVDLVIVDKTGSNYYCNTLHLHNNYYTLINTFMPSIIINTRRMHTRVTMLIILCVCAIIWCVCVWMCMCVCVKSQVKFTRQIELTTSFHASAGFLICRFQ